MDFGALIKNSKKNFKGGFLCKKGATIKSWHKRYFLLKDDVLFYFKDDQDPYHPIAIIYLYKGTINRKPLYSKKNHTFLVNTQGRRYHFQAENDEERESWCEILEICVKNATNKDVDVIADLQKQLEKEKMKVVSLSKNIDITLKPLKELSEQLRKVQHTITVTDKITRVRTRGVTLQKSSLLDDSVLYTSTYERLRKANEEVIYLSDLIKEIKKQYLGEQHLNDSKSLKKIHFDPITQKIDQVKSDKNDIQVLLIKIQEEFVKSTQLILKKLDTLVREQNDKSKLQMSLAKKQVDEKSLEEEKEKLKLQILDLKDKTTKKLK